jgi:hypothetical protein
MKYIIDLFMKFIPKEYFKNVKPLGRWKIDYCNKVLNNKIDLSNEDHCFCNKYLEKKLEDKNNKKSN